MHIQMEESSSLKWLSWYGSRRRQQQQQRHGAETKITAPPAWKMNKLTGQGFAPDVLPFKKRTLLGNAFHSFPPPAANEEEDGEGGIR